VNEDLRDLVILHGLRLDRLLSGHLRAIDRLFVGARKDLRGVWDGVALRDIGDLRFPDVAARVRALEAAWSASLEGVVGATGLAMTEAATAEAAFWLAYARGGIPENIVAAIPFDIRAVNPATIAAISDSEVLGLTPAAWREGAERGFVRDVTNALREAQGLGESVAAATRRIDALAVRYGMGGAPGSAESMARTMFLGAAQKTADAWAVQNRDLVVGQQWILTFDTRTCPRCVEAENGGKVYPIDKPSPPAPLHPRCRCQKVPVLRSWRDLGIDIDELPPGDRAAMNGTKTDAQTWDQWLRRQSPAIQKEALGPKKWEAWVSAGRPSVGKFVSDGRVLTLAALLDRL